MPKLSPRLQALALTPADRLLSIARGDILSMPRRGGRPAGSTSTVPHGTVLKLARALVARDQDNNYALHASRHRYRINPDSLKAACHRLRQQLRKASTSIAA
jgi:hypothetical protein